MLSLKKHVSTNIYKPESIYGENHILNAEQLIWFADKIKSGNIEINGKLFKDIDISDKRAFIGIETS